MSRIFVIEDDEAISNLICMNLSVVGYEVQAARDGAQALRMLEGGAVFDLALVDVMLPEIGGFDLLGPLNNRNIPVIYLTARNDIESKIRGLKGGAEDYIVKPFEILELLVRIEKVLERRGQMETVHRCGGVELDVRERAVTLNGAALPLKPRQFDLLLILMKNKNIALSREKLLAEIWGVDFIGETRTVDVHIAQLRKITGLHIVSVPKIGYRLELEP